MKFVVSNTGDWEHASMIYVAKGGERFVIVGNFFSNEETKNKRLPWRFGKKNNMLDYKSYYFIDDVSVKPCRFVEAKHVFLKFRNSNERLLT